MHEYSIVQALFARIEQEAQRRGATAVHRVALRIGEASGVEAGLLRTAYDTFRARTICARAPLDIALVPAAWGCSRCGAEIGRGAVLSCSRCGAPARLVRGDDIVLERLEMEVP